MHQQFKNETLNQLVTDLRQASQKYIAAVKEIQNGIPKMSTALDQFQNSISQTSEAFEQATRAWQEQVPQIFNVLEHLQSNIPQASAECVDAFVEVQAISEQLRENLLSGVQAIDTAEKQWREKLQTGILIIDAAAEKRKKNIELLSQNHNTTNENHS